MRIVKRLDDGRKGNLVRACFQGKAQVTVEDDGDTPGKIKTIVVLQVSIRGQNSEELVQIFKQCASGSGL
jgi:hypothetical protein